MSLWPTASLLVSSFDGYGDCWEAVFYSLLKYWPDCPFPIYLIANRREFCHPSVRVLRVPGQDWSSSLLCALDSIDTEYVLYFQEDYWLSETVDTPRIRDYLKLMDAHGLHYIRLLANPTPDGHFIHDHRLGIIADQASYRTSVQVSLWRASVLRFLLRPGESAWDFEVQGTRRSRIYGDRFLSVRCQGKDDYFHGVRYLCSAINRGKWSREARRYAEREGIQVDFSNLPVETWWDDFKRVNAFGRLFALWGYRTHLFLTHPAIALKKARKRLGL